MITENNRAVQEGKKKKKKKKKREKKRERERKKRGNIIHKFPDS